MKRQQRVHATSKFITWEKIISEDALGSILDLLLFDIIFK